MVCIKINIKNCTECPHFTRERMYTEDSWEEAYNWFCNEPSVGKKKIQGYVEWNDVKNIEVPNWCPIIVK